MINLGKELFIGKGWHKITYIDPRDRNRCIKIVHHEHEISKDTDLSRELWYRHTRKQRGLNSTLLTKYYGTVATNKGTGYVFERVVDFDSRKSLNFREFLEKQNQFVDIHASQALIKNILVYFKQKFFEEKIITTNMEYDNFLIQKTSENYQTFSVKIIDNLGSPVLIPLSFYVNYFALKHCKHYWKRFIVNVHNDYPNLLTESVLKSLY